MLGGTLGIGGASEVPAIWGTATSVVNLGAALDLTSGDSTVGVINIESTRVGAFDQTDVTAIRTLSDQVAQAIENARLYDEMRYLRELDESMPMAEALKIQDELGWPIIFSEDAKEGMKAFKEKRKPSYKGR